MGWTPKTGAGRSAVKPQNWDPLGGGAQWTPKTGAGRSAVQPQKWDRHGVGNDMTGYLLLFCAALFTCAGQLCQKQAAGRWKQATDAKGASERLSATMAWIAAACLFMGLGLLAWLLVLQTLPVGQAYPSLSINFVLVALSAKFIFKEETSARLWLGVAAVTAGVMLMGISS